MKINPEGVAVVLLNYNKKKDLLCAIESVYQSDYEKVSLVVVDNNSIDGSADAVAEAYPETALIRNPENTGVSKGRNTGWRYAKENFDFEYILFLDDDAELSVDYLSKLVETYKKDSSVGVAIGKAYVNREERRLCSAGISVNLYTGKIYDLGAGEIDTGQYDSSGYLDACGGFAFSSRRALFDDLGAFDESFSPYGWEDVDYCLRMREKGFKTFYMADAIVVHKGTKAGRKPVPAYEQNKVKNYFLLLKRHASPVQKVTSSVFVVMKAIYIMFEMIRSGNGKVIVSQFKGFFQALSR